MVYTEELEALIRGRAEGVEAFDEVADHVSNLRQNVHMAGAEIEATTRKTDVFTRSSLMQLRSGLMGVFRALEIVGKGNQDWTRGVRGVQAAIQSLSAGLQLYDTISKIVTATKWGQAAAETAAGGIIAPAVAGGIIAGLAIVAGGAAAGFKVMGEGGSFVATQPTPVIVGDRGPELFTAIPLGGARMGGAPSSVTYVTILSRHPDAVGEAFTEHKQVLQEAGRA